MTQSCDIAIIGAGPSGAVAAALLLKHGFSVCVLEKQHFPRFVIGESLLPHCMEFSEEADASNNVVVSLEFDQPLPAKDRERLQAWLNQRYEGTAVRLLVNTKVLDK